MSYIIVWRNSHREPFVELDTHGFRNLYDNYEDAKESAEEFERIENENERSPWYFDYKIYCGAIK